jgi:hypothetical protein
MIFRHIFPAERFFFVSHSHFNLSEGWQLLSSWAEVQSAAKTETTARIRTVPAGYLKLHTSHTPPRTPLPDEVIWSDGFLSPDC